MVSSVSMYLKTLHQQVKLETKNISYTSVIHVLPTITNKWWLNNKLLQYLYVIYTFIPKKVSVHSFNLKLNILRKKAIATLDNQSKYGTFKFYHTILWFPCGVLLISFHKKAIKTIYASSIDLIKTFCLLWFSEESMTYLWQLCDVIMKSKLGHVTG